MKDPVQEEANFFDKMAEKDRYTSHIEELMEIKRNAAIKKLSTVVRPDLAELMAHVLAYACEQEYPQAILIAIILGLKGIDMLAIENNFVRFEDKLNDEANEQYQEIES